jgi:hypothetical protein
LLLDGVLRVCLNEVFRLSVSTLRQQVLHSETLDVFELQYVRHKMCALRFAEVCGRGEVGLPEQLNVHFNQYLADEFDVHSDQFMQWRTQVLEDVGTVLAGRKPDIVGYLHTGEHDQLHDSDGERGVDDEPGSVTRYATVCEHAAGLSWRNQHHDLCCRKSYPIQIDTGSTVLTTLSLQGNGCAYWYISPGLNAGTYSITSVYSGDSNNPLGTSAPTVLTVSPVPVNMSASCWNASFPYGANYQCTVNVSSNAGSAQGNITYSYDSGAPVAVPLSGGSAQFTITEPPVGTQNVVIGYAQQTNYAAAQPQTENFTVTSAAVQVSLAPSTWYATVGTNITFSAAVASWSAGPPQNGSVSFYDGSTLLSTVPVNSSGQGSYTTSSLPAGSQTITAAYSGGANYASGSTGVTITLAQ